MRVYFRMLDDDATRKDAMTYFVTVSPTCSVGHGIIDVNGAFVHVLWYLFVPVCSHRPHGNIRLSYEVNHMRRTFPEEMVHVAKLIEGLQGVFPTLTWMCEHAELASKKRKEHSRKRATLKEMGGVLEEEDFELEQAIIK